MIKMVQLDPNGLCNAKCWYCPVAYGGNPKIGKKNMDINVLEGILKQLDNGRGDFVDLNFKTILNAHYNEILLYPHFQEMIKLYQKYNLETIIFSNGTTFNKEKIDFIRENKNVIKKITLNIPSAFPEEWSRLTGFNIKLFNKLIENLKYIEDELVIKNDVDVVIQVNGIQDNSLFKNGGSITMLNNFPEMNTDPINGDVARNMKKFKKMFPRIHNFADVNLNDRSGKLDENNVMTNIEMINFKKENLNKRVVGCIGGEEEALSRTEEWIHINANGDIIICCHDYDFKTAYINIKDKTLKEIWNSQERKNIIDKSYKDFCINCKYAIWE